MQVILNMYLKSQLLLKIRIIKNVRKNFTLYKKRYMIEQVIFIDFSGIVMTVP